MRRSKGVRPHERPRAPGFDVFWAECFGRFDYWMSPGRRSVTARALLKGLNVLRPTLSTLLPVGVRSYSPYGGIIARRRPRAAVDELIQSVEESES